MAQAHMESRKRERSEPGEESVSRAFSVVLVPNLVLPFPEQLHPHSRFQDNNGFRSTTQVDLRGFAVDQEAWRLIVAYRWALFQSGNCVTVEQRLPWMRQSLIRNGAALVAHQYLYPGELDLDFDLSPRGAPGSEEECLCTGVFARESRDTKLLQLTRENAAQLFPFNLFSNIDIHFMRGYLELADAPQEAVLRERLKQATNGAKEWTSAALLRLILSGQLFAPGKHEGSEVLFQHPNAHECVWLNVNVLVETNEHDDSFNITQSFYSDPAVCSLADS